MPSVWGLSNFPDLRDQSGAVLDFKCELDTFPDPDPLQLGPPRPEGHRRGGRAVRLDLVMGDPDGGRGAVNADGLSGRMTLLGGRLGLGGPSRHAHAIHIARRRGDCLG